ncbi:MAG: orotate phosphoribosyltransferase [Luminiphilus sp.]|nr:orotate phosphoribosyltransferase [Luminiphilus sp.]
MTEEKNEQTRKAFIELAIRCDVLRFGEFELKSGRVSPYFFNAGGFSGGRALATLGACYADTLMTAAMDPTVLFGPAYKGIPLAAATAIALANQHDVDVPYSFNRKERKTHGEGGQLVGAALTGRVIIIDDVITAGTAVREAIDIISASDARPAGIVIGLDRCERGTGSRSAIDEVRQDLGLQVASVITMHDIIAWLESMGDLSQYLDPMRRYRDRYGV